TKGARLHHRVLASIVCVSSPGLTFSWPRNIPTNTMFPEGSTETSVTGSGVDVVHTTSPAGEYSAAPDRALTTTGFPAASSATFAVELLTVGPIVGPFHPGSDQPAELLSS